MKPTRIVTSLVILISVTAILTFISCSKNDPVTGAIPTVTTDHISAITQTSAIGGGDVTFGGGHSVSARGVCWSTNPIPTIASSKTTDGTGSGSFTSNLTGLSPNTSYYVRAYATNNLGTGYGTERSFTTLPENGGETVTDIDGNVYHIITINKRDWLLENLKTTRYSKGEDIPEIVGNSEWSNMDKGGYCNYNKDAANAEIYGRLYNWFAVDDSRNICPTGWHVPTKTEWESLIDHLGGVSIAGGKMKSTGTLQQGNGLWQEPNTGATNESGFTALPGGSRDQDGNFLMLSNNAGFWSSSTDGAEAWNYVLTYKYISTEQSLNDKRYGFSVRCIKDD